MKTTSCAPDFPDLCFRGVYGLGMCVSVKHGLIILSEYASAETSTSKLHVYSLEDGSFVRGLCAPGRGKGQVAFHHGGLCISPDGEHVLVAENWNSRIQEVTISDGSWVRFIGDGVLQSPEFVDCDTNVIVASEAFSAYIHVFAWQDGSAISRFVVSGYNFCFMRCIWLKAAGEVAVTDRAENRLSVFSLSGDLMWTSNEMDGMYRPTSVVGADSNDHLFVAHDYGCSLVHRTERAQLWPSHTLTAICSLPNGGLILREGTHITVCKGLNLRFAWVEGCARLAAIKHRLSSVTTKKRVKCG